MRNHGRWLVIIFAILIAGCAGTGRLSKHASNNPDANRIYQALPKYARLSRSDWQPLYIKTTLKVGSKNSAIPEVRRRLKMLGDLSTQDKNSSTIYDKELAAAVKQFQWRHGIKMSGRVDGKTLRALNVSPRERYRKLSLNMQRFAKFPAKEGSKYIRVNTANFELDIIKDGDKVLSMRIVSGNLENPTPELYSKLQTIVFNPRWNVPKNITQNEIVPKVIKNPNYLQENNMVIYKTWAKNATQIEPENVDWQLAEIEGFPYRITQVAGDKNALGRVKFVFLNKHDIYLHDTPQKGLFSRIQRAYSHGCIRLEKPFKLVEYFVKEDPKLAENVEAYKGSKTLKYVRIKKPIPIYITYITAWVDKKGRSHFREDIYQRDYLTYKQY